MRERFSVYVHESAAHLHSSAELRNLDSVADATRAPCVSRRSHGRNQSASPLGDAAPRERRLTATAARVLEIFSHKKKFFSSREDFSIPLSYDGGIFFRPRSSFRTPAAPSSPSPGPRLRKSVHMSRSSACCCCHDPRRSSRLRKTSTVTVAAPPGTPADTVAPTRPRQPRRHPDGRDQREPQRNASTDNMTVVSYVVSRQRRAGRDLGDDELRPTRA